MLPLVDVELELVLRLSLRLSFVLLATDVTVCCASAALEAVDNTLVSLSFCFSSDGRAAV